MLKCGFLNILACLLALGVLPIQPQERMSSSPAILKIVTPPPQYANIPQTIQTTSVIQKTLTSCSPSFTCVSNSKYRTIDGTCNNLVNPRLGASNMPFFRYLTSVYEDGLDLTRGEGRSPPLPKPRQVSVAISQAERSLSNVDTSLLVMQWGQIVDHDLVFTPENTGPCCDDRVSLTNGDANCRRLDVTNDPFYQCFGVLCLPFHRSLKSNCVSGPREQTNEATAFLDGSSVYGSTPLEQTNLRGANGLLKIGSGIERVPPTNPHCPLTCSYTFLPSTTNPQGNLQILAGDRRAQEQPGLTSMHTLFVRAHNDLGTQLKFKYPTWTSDTVYQETRRIIVAIQQFITYSEFLPVVLGSTVVSNSFLAVPTSGGYTYSSSRVPHAANVFAAAAFRFGHTLIADRFKLANANIELSRSFNNYGLTFIPFQQPSDFLEGIAHAQAENADHFMVESVTNLLFAEAASGFRNGSDLLARNIQRGRDHGIPPYNSWRAFCNLPTFSTFSSLSEAFPQSVVTKLQTIYGSVNDIDLFPALIAEKPVYSDALVGPTLQCLIGKHFYQLKFGDRYWFETSQLPQAFTTAQLNAISRTTLAALICAYTETPVIQAKAFRTISLSNPVRSCQNDIPIGSVPDQILNLF